MTGRRRNVWLDDELMAEVTVAAGLETARTGERVTAAEFIRRAVRERLDRHARNAARRNDR